MFVSTFYRCRNPVFERWSNLPMMEVSGFSLSLSDSRAHALKLHELSHHFGGQSPSAHGPVCLCAPSPPSRQLTSPSFRSRPNPDHLPPPGYDDMYLWRPQECNIPAFPPLSWSCHHWPHQQPCSCGLGARDSAHVFAGWLGLPPHPLSEPRHLLQLSTWLHIGPKEKSVCVSHHQLLPTSQGRLRQHISSTQCSAIRTERIFDVIIKNQMSIQKSCCRLPLFFAAQFLPVMRL